MKTRKQIKNQAEFVLCDTLRKNLDNKIDDELFSDLADELFEKAYYILQNHLSLAIYRSIDE